MSTESHNYNIRKDPTLTKKGKELQMSKKKPSDRREDTSYDPLLQPIFPMMDEEKESLATNETEPVAHDQTQQSSTLESIMDILNKNFSKLNTKIDSQEQKFEQINRKIEDSQKGMKDLIHEIHTVLKQEMQQTYSQLNAKIVATNQTLEQTRSDIISDVLKLNKTLNVKINQDITFV